MRLLLQARSNPLAWWWAALTLASAGNIAVWFVLYRELHMQPAASLAGAAADTPLMLTLCAVYVFGCAFRSLLPRADVQRICLFDTWLSVAWAVVPMIVVAQCCSWYGVLTTNHLAHAVENSIWAVAFLAVGIGLCLLLPAFAGPVRWTLLATIIARAGPSRMTSPSGRMRSPG
jgi:hypothetical protein